MVRRFDDTGSYDHGRCVNGVGAQSSWLRSAELAHDIHKPKQLSHPTFRGPFDVVKECFP